MARIRKIPFIMMLVCWLLAGADVRAATPNVADGPGYLAQSEAEALQQRIETIREQLGLELVIVITESTGGKGSMAYADDYYDTGGYGVGSGYDGLLMLVNMEAREVWISTTGKAIDMFDDARIQKIVTAVSPRLTAGDYYGAGQAFLEQVAAKASFWRRFVSMLASPVLLLVSAAVAAGATLLATFLNRSRVSVTGRTYEVPGSFRLLSKKDDFRNEHVARVRIQEAKSGGSSVHRGSSGRSHGGGGGRF